MKQNTQQGFSFPGRLRFPGIFFLLVCVLSSAAAAEITVPRVEMASRGRVENGEFTLSSILSADLSLTGGYKYAFLLGFSVEAADLAKAFAARNLTIDPIIATPPTEAEYNALVEKVNNQASLGFRIAKATVRELFGLPLEMSYFIGENDNFCTGDDFSSRFGIAPFGTDFRGFFYFPEGIGGVFNRRYNGIHGVRGTGLSLGFTKWDNFIPMLYLYQDFVSSAPNFWEAGKNLYSGDIRFLLHSGSLNLELFGGISAAGAQDSSLRGGVMFHVAGNGMEFFAMGGIPGWAWREKFSVDNIFFLIEPRLHFERFSIFASFFYHPLEYIHITTQDEQGRADINLKFRFGNADAALAGGVEAGTELNINDSDEFVFHVSPFASFLSGGLRWDAKIRIKPQNYDAPGELFDFFIGVRTAF